MRKTIKKSCLMLMLLFFSLEMDAQKNTSQIKGYIKEYKGTSRAAPIKMVLSSFLYSDSITLDKNTDSFSFKEVPYGIYELKVDANRGQTGLKDFIIEDALINKEVIVFDTIFLFPVRTCGSKSQFWVYEYSFFNEIPKEKKEPKEFYPTGELFAEGSYFLAKKYSRKEKSNMYCLQKDGLWKYYYKNGSLLKYVYYNKDEPEAIVGFYENGSVKFKRIFSYNTCHVGEQLYFNLSGEMLFRVKFILNSINTPTMKIKYEYLSSYSKNNQLIERD